jgi:hypothetical protein
MEWKDHSFVWKFNTPFGRGEKNGMEWNGKIRIF